MYCHRLGFSALLVLLASCGDSVRINEAGWGAHKFDAPLLSDNEAFIDVRAYSHNIFGSDEACQKHVSTESQGCYQWLTFYPDGTADVVLDGVLIPGYYQISRVSAQLQVVLQTMGDDYRLFALSKRQEQLTDIANQSVWLRQSEGFY